MLKKVTVLVSFLLLLLLIETLSLCPLAVSAAEPDYILNIDFSKYDEGMTLAEILAADSTIPRITYSSPANATYIVNDNGELEIKTLKAYENGVALGVSFNVPVDNLLEVTRKYYIELEAATMTSKQSQYIIKCQSVGGGEQMFCSGFRIGPFIPSYNGYSSLPGSLDPSLSLTSGTTYTLRHLLNMSERRFDGFWSSTDGGVSFQQHTVDGNTYIPYRYSGMSDPAVELPIIKTINIAGAKDGIAAAGDLLHKIKHIRIWEWESEDSILSRASEKLTLAQINNSSNVVTGNLDLPDSLESFENVNITWSSNKQSIISNSGAVNLPWENTDVTLTATLELNGFTVQKPFPLLVRGVSEGYIYDFSTDTMDGHFTKTGEAGISDYNGKNALYIPIGSDVNFYPISAGEAVSGKIANFETSVTMADTTTSFAIQGQFGSDLRNIFKFYMGDIYVGDITNPNNILCKYEAGKEYKLTSKIDLLNKLNNITVTNAGTGEVLGKVLKNVSSTELTRIKFNASVTNGNECLGAYINTLKMDFEDARSITLLAYSDSATLEVTDNNGNMPVMVEFYDNTTLLGTVYNAPYKITLSNLEEKTYLLKAIAYYEDGSVAKDEYELKVSGVAPYVTESIKIMIDGCPLNNLSELSPGFAPLYLVDVSNNTLADKTVTLVIASYDANSLTNCCIKKDQVLTAGSTTELIVDNFKTLKQTAKIKAFVVENDGELINIVAKQLVY